MSSTAVLPLMPWNEHFITTERTSQTVGECALARALDLMILGQVQEANKIVTTLYNHDVLQFENHFDMLYGMCFAWSESKDWPDFITKPDPSRPRYVRDECWDTLAFDNIESIMEKWQREQREQYLPDFHEAALKTSPYLRMRDNASLLAEIDTALTTNDQAIVEKLIHESVTAEFRGLSSDGDAYKDRYYANEQSHKCKRVSITNCRTVWPLFCTGVVARELQLSSEDITAYVDRGVDLLEKRFTQGRTRSYGYLSMAELVRQLDEDSMFMLRAYDNANEGKSRRNFPLRAERDTLTAPPATQSEIDDLERKLGVVLEDDYKEFLRLTSYFGERPQEALVHIPAHVGWSDTALEHFHDMEAFPFMPYTYTAIDLMDKFVWPDDLHAYDIGNGNDEGYVWVYGRSQILVALEEFESVYREASAGEKRIYARAARDLYGGLEEMRSMQYLLVFWSRGELDPLPFNGFRAYLEYAAEEQRLFREMEENDQKKRGEK